MFSIIWCRPTDLNRHERNAHRILSPACLPIPPGRLQTTLKLLVNIIEGSRKKVQHLRRFAIV